MVIRPKNQCAPLLVILSAILIASGCSKSIKTDFGPENTRLIGRSEAESAKPGFDLGEGLESGFDNVRNWYPVVQQELDSLERRILTGITGVESLSTAFDAPNLKYSGIDRTKAKKTYSQDQIEISRWRYHKGAPKFEENALRALIDNMYEPWTEAKNFRTKLSPSNIARTEDKITATIVARTFGVVRQNVGVESTSMWKTHWQIVSEGVIELTMVQTLAIEETVSSSDGGTIFQDITYNVLDFETGLSQQLDHGMTSGPRVSLDST